MKTVRPARFSTRVSAALKLIYLQVSRTSVYGKEITTGIVCVCKHRIHIAFPASMPKRIKGLSRGESSGRMPVQGNVLRAGALKRYLEDGMRIAPPCAILNSSLLCKLGTVLLLLPSVAVLWIGWDS